jgi:hypothetical protein
MAAFVAPPSPAGAPDPDALPAETSAGWPSPAEFPAAAAAGNATLNGVEAPTICGEKATGAPAGGSASRDLPLPTKLDSVDVPPGAPTRAGKSVATGREVAVTARSDPGVNAGALAELPAERAPPAERPPANCAPPGCPEDAKSVGCDVPAAIAARAGPISRGSWIAPSSGVPTSTATGVSPANGTAGALASDVCTGSTPGSSPLGATRPTGTTARLPVAAPKPPTASVRTGDPNNPAAPGERG